MTANFPRLGWYKSYIGKTKNKTLRFLSAAQSTSCSVFLPQFVSFRLEAADPGTHLLGVLEHPPFLTLTLLVGGNFLLGWECAPK